MSLIEYATCPHGHGSQEVVDVHDEAVLEPAGMYGTREVELRVTDLACGCYITRETGVRFS